MQKKSIKAKEPSEVIFIRRVPKLTKKEFYDKAKALGLKPYELFVAMVENTEVKNA